MEPHSLVLLSGSTLDTCHHTHIHGAQPRRAQPLPVCGGPRRPFRDLAQGLARLLPQLRQLSQRLRRTPRLNNADACVRTWPSTCEDETPSASAAPCSTVTAAQIQVHHHSAARWRSRRRAQRARPHDHHLARHQQQQRAQQQQQEQLPHLGKDTLQLQPLVPHATLQPQPRRGPLRRLGRALRCVSARMRPMGPGENDKNMPERIVNVATCGMFLQAGGKIVRLCSSLAARRFGWAFIAVGVIATIYHGSWGRFRNVARKLDYYSIALSSLLLRSAVVGPVPRWLTATMVAAMPFKPTLVSGSNFVAVEVRYLLLALSQRHLFREWVAHTGLSVAATACFTLDETPPFSWCPYTHAAFHVLSAAAFLTLPSALNHITVPLPTAAAA